MNTSEFESYVQGIEDKRSSILTKSEEKLLNLSNRSIEKKTNLQYKSDNLLGLQDADSGITTNMGSYRSDYTNTAYDAVELGHNESDPLKAVLANKWKKDSQLQQVSQLIGKPVDQITSQDVIDVGNMQQIQKLSDLARSKGQERWEAPLIRGAEQTNLTGRYVDEIGNPIEAPLNIPINVRDTDKDTYGRDVIGIQNPNTGIDVTQEAATDPRLNANYSATTAENRPTFLDTLRNPADMSTRGGAADEVSQTARGIVASLSGGAIKTVDALETFGSFLAEQVYKKATGEDITIDMITPEMRDSAIEYVDKSVGYDRTYDEKDLEKIVTMAVDSGFDITNTDTYAPFIEEYGVEAAMLLLKNPSLTASLISEIVGGGGALGAGTKIAGKVGTKIAPKFTEAIGNTVKLNRTKTTDAIRAIQKDTTLSVADKTAKIAKTKEAYTIGKKAIDFIKGTSTTNADLAMRMNNDIEEYTKNNNGEGPDGYKAIEILGINRLLSNVEIGSLKISAGIVAEAKEIVKKGIATVVTHLGKSIGMEAIQETMDGIGEQINQKLDSGDYEGKTVQDILKATSAEILAGTFTGAAGGAHLGSIGAISKVVPDIADSKQAKNKIDDKIQELKTNVSNIDDSVTKVMDTEDVSINRAGTILNTIVDGSYKNNMQATLDEINDISNKTDSKELKDQLATVKTQYFTDLATKDITPDNVVLGSEQEAKDMIEDIVLYSEPAEGTDITKNLQVIANANNISTEQLTTIIAQATKDREKIKTLRDVSEDAKHGPLGYVTYGKNMRAALRANKPEEASVWEKKLISFGDAHQEKLDVMANAIKTIESDIASGIQTNNKIKLTRPSNGKSMGFILVEGKGTDRTIAPGSMRIFKEVQAEVDAIKSQLKDINIKEEPTIATNAKKESSTFTGEDKQKAKVTDIAMQKREGNELSNEDKVYYDSNKEAIDKEVATINESLGTPTETSKPTGITSILKPSKKTTKLFTEGVKGLTESNQKLATKISNLLDNVLDPKKGVKGKALEEILKESPARRLIYDKNGNVNRAVALAIEATGVEYIAFNSNMLGYKTKADMARVLGVAEYEVDSSTRVFYNENGMTTGIVAEAIGRNILANLGMKDSDVIDYREYKKLIADLGNTALHLQETQGRVTLHSIGPVEYQEATGITVANDLPFVRMTDTYNNATPERREEFRDKAKKVYEGVAEDIEITTDMKRGPSTEKIKNKSKGMKARNNEYADVPQEVIDAINKAQDIEYTKNTESLDYIKKNEQLIKDRMGWKDLNLFKGSKDAKNSQEAVNLQIENSVEELLALEGDNFYFEWFYTKNGRYMMDSNTINPQSDKLHRFVVVPKDATVTIDMSNTKDMDKLYYALAQATGFSVDKKKVAESIAKGKEIVARGSKQLEADISNMDIKIEHIGHYLQAVQTVKSIENTKDGKVTTDIAAEFDALTSGFGIKLMQFPILKNIYGWLEKVGVFTDRPIKVSMSDELTGLRDSYQTLAGQITTEGLSPESDKYKIWDTLKEVLPKAQEGVQISPELRSLFKDPFMTFNYAAGFKSIQESLSFVITDKLFDEMAKGNKVYDNLYTKLNESIDTTDGTLREQLRTKEVDKIKMKNGGTLGRHLRTMVIETYGVEVKSILEAEFKPFIDLNKEINSGFKAMYESFIKGYKDELSTIKGPITEKIRRATINKHIDKFPMIKGPLSKTFKEGVAIYSSKKEGLSTEWNATTKLANKRNSRVTTIVRELEVAVSAGSGIPIHFIDGSVMNALMKSGMKGQFIHDAIIPNLLDMGNRVKQYNKEWLEVNERYSVVQELVDSMNRNGITISDKLLDFNKQIQQARKELKSKAKHIGHMVGMEDSVYRTGDISSKETSQYNDKQIRELKKFFAFPMVAKLLKDATIDLKDC